MILNKIYVDNLIKTALLEDINYCDVTTDYLIPAEQMGKGKLVAKAEGILCGVEVAARVFELIDSDIKIEILIKDGESVKYGDEIMRLEGRTASLLKGERTALNLIQHMSGIATAANQATKLVEGTNASIADTRKTLPGMRPLQKYAVMTGGAKNHRYNLSDAAMLKDNHHIHIYFLLQRESHDRERQERKHFQGSHRLLQEPLVRRFRGALVYCSIHSDDTHAGRHILL